MLGEVLDGRYRILGNLGAGAVGAVYQVEHVHLKKSFAAKILYKNMRPKLIKRFEREALAASRIEHPNIVQTIDFGYDDRLGHFCILEYLRGESLQDRMAHLGPMTPQQIRPLIKQLTEGLHAAHQAGIIHRDLKPTNVFVQTNESTGEEVLKVLDFGLAKLLDFEEAELADLSYTGQVLGTPSYMAPEQTRGVEHVDHRADIYAAGLILYRMVTGRRPFDAKSISEVLYLQQTADPAPPEEIVPNSEAARLLKTVLEKVLEKEPGDRYQTARDFGAAVSLALSGDDAEPPRQSLSSAAETTTDRAGARFQRADTTPPPDGLGKPAAGSRPTQQKKASPEVQEQLQSMEFAKIASWEALGNEQFKISDRSRGPWAWITALLLVAIAAIGIAVYVRSAQERRGSQLPPRNTDTLPGKTPQSMRTLVIVAPFTDHTGDKSLAWYGAGLADMFITELARDGKIPVVSRRRVSRWLRRKDKSAVQVVAALRGLADTVGARWILWGTYRKDGAGKFLISVKIEDLTKEAVVYAGSSAPIASLAGVLGEVSLLAGQMRVKLGGSPITPQKKKKTISGLRTANSRAYAAYIRGEVAFHNENYAQAEIQFKAALSHDPDFVMARYGLAQTYEYQDERAKARGVMDEALKRVSGRSKAEVLFVRAYHAFLYNRMGDSLALCRKLVAQMPDDTFVLTFYLEVLAHNGQPREMLQVANRIERLDPADLKHHEHKILALSELGEHQRAVLAAERYLGLSPDSPKPLEMLSRAYYRKGDYDKALAMINRPRARKSRWVDDMAFNILIDVGRLKEAIQVISGDDLSSTDVVKRTNALNCRAEAYILKGAYAKAAAEINASLTLSPKFAYSHYFKGILALKQGRLPDAASALNSLTGANIGSWDRDLIPLLEAQIAIKRRKFDEARRALARAERMRGIWDKSPNKNRTLLAEIALLSSDFTACHQLAKQMLDYNKNEHAAVLYRAKCFDKDSRNDSALELYREFARRMASADTDYLDLVFARARIKALSQP